MAASTSESQTLHHFRKRSLSGSDSDEPDYKTARKISYFYVLEPSSESSSGLEDTESVYSLQGKPTDSAKDTSDLSYSEDSNIVYTIGGGNIICTRLNEEYEPASLSEKENSIPDVLSSASDGDNAVQTFPSEVILSTHDEDTWADSSSISSEGEPLIDPELSFKDYWSCVQCNTTNNNPLYRYCEKCFKIRKNFFPPRPKLNKKKKKKKQRIRRKKDRKNSENKFSEVNDASSKQEQGECPGENVDALSSFQTPSRSSLNSDSIVTDNSLNMCKDSAVGSSFNQASGSGSSSFSTVILDSHSNEFSLSKTSDLSGLSKASSQDVPRGDLSMNTKESSLCETCLARPKDGVFVHGRKLGHMFCCYQCSKKVWKERRRCPLCNGKISQVLKVIS